MSRKELMERYPELQNSMSHPRFSGIPSFMRAPVIDDFTAYDIAMVGVPYDGEAEFMAIPDFSGADRDQYEFLRWPMDPGDVLVFHSMTVHGGSGDLPDQLWRRSISAQWLGEDARVTTRPGGCVPDLLPEFASNGIVLGDHPACSMCPTVTATGELLQ